VQGPDGLEYAGHVGTGFTAATLKALGELLEPLRIAESPFATAVPRMYAKDAVWVEPRLVAEIDYTEWTKDGRLRHPSYKGLRDDYDPKDVFRE
jgi:bifunctional non-homologous end joining protein LigD